MDRNFTQTIKDTWKFHSFLEKPFLTDWAGFCLALDVKKPSVLIASNAVLVSPPVVGLSLDPVPPGEGPPSVDISPLVLPSHLSVAGIEPARVTDL